MVKIEKYFTVFKIAAIHALKNYKALMGLSIFLVTCLVIFAHLWKIAAAKAGVVHLNPEQQRGYIAINERVLIYITDVHDEMEQDLRSGRLAYLIPRPISYLGCTFSEALGTLSVNLLVLGLVTFIFTWFVAGSLPFHPIGLLFAILFGLLSGCVALIFLMMIGLSAFWLQEVSPFHWLWEKLLFMLGGLILPLAVYPQWMQKIAYLTPFPAILGERSALAIDFNGYQITLVAISLVGWGVIGIIGLFFIYRRGLRILNIEGG
ncbi:MAG: ABC transporter permease [Chlamydiales bacterium]